MVGNATFAGGSSAGKRLRRANLVVLLAPFVETGLLSSELESVFAHRLVLERSMHPLMAAVLVGPDPA